MFNTIHSFIQLKTQDTIPPPPLPLQGSSGPTWHSLLNLNSCTSTRVCVCVCLCGHRCHSRVQRSSATCCHRGRREGAHKKPHKWSVISLQLTAMQHFKKKTSACCSSQKQRHSSFGTREVKVHVTSLRTNQLPNTSHLSVGLQSHMMAKLCGHTFRLLHEHSTDGMWCYQKKEKGKKKDLKRKSVFKMIIFG